YEVFIFFFQAEDGIRDKLVTGVQTCALPISLSKVADDLDDEMMPNLTHHVICHVLSGERDRAVEFISRIERENPNNGRFKDWARSEERRVGKEGRAGWSPYEYTKK